MNKVLVVAVHTDDETLGCGGTLFKHKASGDKIYWLIATKAAKGPKFNKRELSEINEISRLYDFDGVYKLGFPTRKLDGFSADRLIREISAVINKVKPNIVYLPFHKDVHSDHRMIFEAAYSCTKIFRYPFIKRILMMETLSETEFALSVKENAFVPNYFIDITSFSGKKKKAMEIYKGEIKKHPFPRSLENIDALATFRGAMAGCKYAEAFMLLKEMQ